MPTGMRRHAMTAAAFAFAALLTLSGAFIGCGGGGGNNDNTSALCGNGVVDTGERCDDGNRNNGDGCASNCLQECFLAGQQRVVCTVGQFCCAQGNSRQCLALGSACTP